MMKKFYILSLLLVASAGQVLAQQKTDRDYLRSGNKLYNDSLFIKAEVDYRKALEINPKSTDAMFNLANALLMQQKAQEAMEHYYTGQKYGPYYTENQTVVFAGLQKLEGKYLG